MPVCPFIKKDLDNDEILFLVQTKKDEFIDLVKKWDESGKKTGLIIQMNMPQYGDKRRKYQGLLNRKIKKVWPRSADQPKVLVFDPTENWSLADVETRKMAPTLLINLARRKDLADAHKTLTKTKWYDKLSNEDLKQLAMEPKDEQTIPSDNS
tara:strand:- start:1756 stop:2214 length:459 start_codon:yes stop_codon:yes gene_type:complete